MADLSDVLDGFASVIAAVLYPNGTSQPSAIGNAVRIYDGWPIQADLDADLAAKPPVVNVSVFNLTGDRDVTRFTRTWDAPLVPAVPTITATVAGNKVTIGGSITAGNYVTIVAGNQAASYGLDPADTPSTIAASLAAQFMAPVVVSASGPVLTFASGFNLIAARCAAPQMATQEIQRLQKRFQITVWASSDALRTAAGKLIVPAIMATAGLALADGTVVRVWPVSDMTDDTKQRANAYLRDIVYLVEYPTTISEAQYPVTTIEADIAAKKPDGTTSPATQINI